MFGDVSTQFWFTHYHIPWGRCFIHTLCLPVCGSDAASSCPANMSVVYTTCSASNYSGSLITFAWLCELPGGKCIIQCCTADKGQALQVFKIILPVAVYIKGKTCTMKPSVSVC